MNMPTHRAGETAAASAALTSAPSCRFPRFSSDNANTTAGATRRPNAIASARVPLQQTDTLKLLTDHDPDKLGAVIKTAWALLLRCYTGQDQVSFGFITQNPLNNTNTNNSIDNASIEVAQILRLNDSSSLAETIFRAKTELNPQEGVVTPVPAPAADQSHHIPAAPTQPRPRPTNASADNLEDRPLLPFDTAIILWDFAKTSTPHLHQKSTSPSPYNLRLLAKQHGTTALSLFLEWSPSLLGPHKLGALVAGTLGKIISEVVNSPAETKVGDLNCLSQSNLDQVCMWNDEATLTQHVQPLDQCVHDVIADRVAENPDGEAVCAWDGSFTYHELGHVTDTLAAHLVNLGVGPEVLVPLCFDKSVCICVSSHPNLCFIRNRVERLINILIRNGPLSRCSLCSRPVVHLSLWTLPTLSID